MIFFVYFRDNHFPVFFLNFFKEAISSYVLIFGTNQIKQKQPILMFFVFFLLIFFLFLGIFRTF